jgi:hypothetical protein
MVQKRSELNTPSLGALRTWRVERHVGRKAELVVEFFMSTEEIALYLRDKDFRRNEAIFILNHVDLMPIEDLAEAWNLSVDEVKKIIALHTEYWQATETTA